MREAAKGMRGSAGARDQGPRARGQGPGAGGGLARRLGTKGQVGEVRS